jgi:hypothetical protein
MPAAALHQPNRPPHKTRMHKRFRRRQSAAALPKFDTYSRRKQAIDHKER